jgi:hypothetical protein
MAHSVTFTLPERDLGKADVEFRVKNDGSVYGTLKFPKARLFGTTKTIPTDTRMAGEISTR